MKFRFTITDLLVFMTALAVYIAVVTQARFILWHLAAASGLMGLLVGTVIGACYGGRQRAVWAGIMGAAGACCYAGWTDPNYWLKPLQADHIFSLALCALGGAIPLASVGALFKRSGGEMLGWTVWNCAVAILIPCLLLWLLLLSIGIAEIMAHPAKTGLLTATFVIGLIVMAVMLVFASGVGVAAATGGMMVRAILHTIGVSKSPAPPASTGKPATVSDDAIPASPTR